MITLRNHQLLDLREVTAVGDSVIGMSVRDPTRRMAAAMVDIAAIEERRVDVAGPLLIALGVYLMVGLIALVGYDRSGG